MGGNFIGKSLLLSLGVFLPVSAKAVSCPSESEIQRLCQASARAPVAQFVIRSTQSREVLAEINSCTDGYRALCGGARREATLLSALNGRAGDCVGQSQEACLAAAAIAQRGQGQRTGELALHQGQMGSAAGHLGEISRAAQRISEADRERARRCFDGNGQLKCNLFEFEELRARGLIRPISSADCSRDNRSEICGYLGRWRNANMGQIMSGEIGNDHSDTFAYRGPRGSGFIAEGGPGNGTFPIATAQLGVDNGSISGQVHGAIPNSANALSGPGDTRGPPNNTLFQGLGQQGTYAEPLLAVRPPPATVNNPFPTTGASSLPEHQRILQQVSEEQRRLEDFSKSIREKSFRDSLQNFQKSDAILGMAKRTESKRGEMGSLAKQMTIAPLADLNSAGTGSNSETGRRKKEEADSSGLFSRASESDSSLVNSSAGDHAPIQRGKNSDKALDSLEGKGEVIAAKGKEDKAAKARRGAARTSLEAMLRKLGKSESEIAAALKQFDESEQAQGARALASLADLLNSKGGKEGTPGFEMLGSETDATIRRLHGELDSERGILPEDTEDLFTRVRSTHRRSESLGRVVSFSSPRT